MSTTEGWNPQPASASTLLAPPAEPQQRPNRSLGVIAGIAGTVLVLFGAGVLGSVTFSLVRDGSSTSLGSSQYSGGYGHQELSTPIVSGDLDVSDATAAQKRGVVTILTELYYDSEAQAAGTGMVLTADGQVLTNNHVIEGATRIEVTIESTGETFEAEIVGTDATKDVALLQLLDAVDLDTVTLDTDNALQLYDEVASIGNAQGTGDLVVAEGFVISLGLDADIGDGYSDSFESLTNLIEVDADVVSGDSGGPLVDSDGEVVGVVTAASSGPGNITGFAITINDAMAIVTQIRNGDDSGTVRIGPSAFMGVQLAEDQDGTGVLIAGPIAGTPADSAGLAEGDLITAVDGVPVLEIEDLTGIIDAHEPGDTLRVTYTDSAGDSHTVPITLAIGPA